MKKIKIGITAFIIIFTLPFALFSCSENDKKTDLQNNFPADMDESENVEEPESTTEEIKDSLPDNLDFGGETLNLYAFANGKQFYIESETGDVFNDALYRRLISVEERLGMKINHIIEEVEDWNSNIPLTKIRASMAAGDRNYDLISGWALKLTPLSVEGLFMNLHDIPYLTLSEPWWNKNIQKELTIGNKLHFIAGDICQNLLMSTNCVTFNKSLIKEYGLPDLYEVVSEGKWTLDYMGELVKNIYKDVNGDGIRGSEDLYGICFRADHHTVFTPSTNSQLIKIGSDGYPHLDPDLERLAGLVEKVYDLLYENNGTIYTASDNGDILDAMFKESRAMMVYCRLYDPQTYYRGVEWDYGIVPCPKYDEAQEQYYSFTGEYISFLCVPNNCEKTELTGAFMEAMAYESFKKVTPVLFDIVMDIKVARDEETVKMLDIIRSGAYMSFESMYKDSLGEAGNMMENLVRKKSKDFASWYETNEIKITNALNKFIAKIEEIG
ncbi:MAG: extracellular solute-binding protein [Oscillospiraceae bacterium]|nr:extracellular solute-binding protein [Oscillospiraceae bacterium]